MFVSERLNEILKLIEEKGKVEVNNLSNFFKVSKDLIRKDLSKLEEQGLLERTYGGAIKKRQFAKTITIASRILENLEIKKKIALKGLNEIKEYESIFLDISSINYILAQDIMHLFSLNPNSKTKLVGIGGNCNNIIDGFVGISAINQINHFNIDRCFIGAIGVNLYNGNVSTYDQEDGLTKSAIISMSKNKYLITEKRKIDQDGQYNFSNLKFFDYIIIDDDISKDKSKEFKKYKVKII